MSEAGITGRFHEDLMLRLAGIEGALSRIGDIVEGSGMQQGKTQRGHIMDLVQAIERCADAGMEVDFIHDMENGHSVTFWVGEEEAMRAPLRGYFEEARHRAL